ncbi:MAG: hypothetical protein GYA51_10565 [Candidatus Methanofastidiosa archaeon]|nr:hypothetical protein [Candidatus Methanofastidiosa archaeon]
MSTRRLTIELQDELLGKLGKLSTDNYRQLGKQIMTILHQELIKKGDDEY